MSSSPAAKPGKPGKAANAASATPTGDAAGQAGLASRPAAEAPLARKPADAPRDRTPADAQPAGEPGVTLVPIHRRSSAARHNPAWTIKHNGHRYAVFDLAGELLVTDARCPHNGGPLSEGIVRDGAVTCPWHWYCFDLRTGECRTSAGYQLRTYRVLSRGGRLFAELPGVARPGAWLRLLRGWWPARKAAD